MAQKYIEQAPGGELTNPTGDEYLPVTDTADDFYLQIANLVIRKLRETGGPTTLDMGSMPDGKYLKRSGTSLIADDVTAIEESGGPTSLSIGAIPDGDYVKRSGSSLVGGEVTSVQESGGPTVLSVGAIADGKVVKRSGSSLVGGETTTIQESSGPTVLSIGAIANGEFLKRSGSSLVSAQPSEWTEVSATWSYASSTTVTVPSDATTVYQKGDKVRLKQGGSYKYFYITGVASTTLTLYGGSDYSVANAAITDIAYSRADEPYGFPSMLNFTPSWANVTVGNATVVAKLKIIERYVIGYITLKFAAAGVTTTISGQIGVYFPISATTSWVGYEVLGAAGMVDWTTALYMGAVVNNGVMEVRAINAAGTYAVWSATSGTVPFTWAANDLLTIEFKYPMA